MAPSWCTMHAACRIMHHESCILHARRFKKRNHLSYNLTCPQRGSPAPLEPHSGAPKAKYRAGSETLKRPALPCLRFPLNTKFFLRKKGRTLRIGQHSTSDVIDFALFLWFLGLFIVFVVFTALRVPLAQLWSLKCIYHISNKKQGD